MVSTILVECRSLFYVEHLTLVRLQSIDVLGNFSRTSYSQTEPNLLDMRDLIWLLLL